MERDDALRQAVCDALAAIDRLDASFIQVAVTDGVVTLTGQVNSYAECQAAHDAAHRVAGVLDVASDLDVRLAPGLLRPDTRIAKRIRRALRWQTHTPHERIRSTVMRGWVTLEGSVDNAWQREEVAQVVGSLIGVRGVTNKLQVVTAEVELASTAGQRGRLLLPGPRGLGWEMYVVLRADSRVLGEQPRRDSLN